MSMPISKNDGRELIRTTGSYDEILGPRQEQEATQKATGILQRLREAFEMFSNSQKSHLYKGKVSVGAAASQSASLRLPPSTHPLLLWGAPQSPLEKCMSSNKYGSSGTAVIKFLIQEFDKMGISIELIENEGFKASPLKPTSLLKILDTLALQVASTPALRSNFSSWCPQFFIKNDEVFFALSVLLIPRSSYSQYLHDEKPGRFN